MTGEKDTGFTIFCPLCRINFTSGSDRREWRSPAGTRFNAGVLAEHTVLAKVNTAVQTSAFPDCPHEDNFTSSGRRLAFYIQLLMGSSPLMKYSVWLKAHIRSGFIISLDGQHPPSLSDILQPV